MSNRYAPLPNPRSLPDSERELDEAFESDDELDQDHTESTPLVSSRPPVSSHTPRSLSLAIPSPAPYDFERDFDYDRPPPGSPPGPSTVAIPNDIGNSNGLLPSSPVRQSIGRPPIFRRMFGALLPQYYSSLPTEAIASSRAVGGGTDNDGVFANVTAKPGRAVEVRDTNGDVHFVPEETQKDAPPVSVSITLVSGWFAPQNLWLNDPMFLSCCRPTSRPRRMQYLNTGKLPFMHP